MPRLWVWFPVRAHTESTDECINKWNNKLMFLSLPSSLSKIKKKYFSLKNPLFLPFLFVHFKKASLDSTFLSSYVTGPFLQRTVSTVLSADHSSAYWNLGLHWTPKVTNNFLITKCNRAFSVLLLLTSLQHLTHLTTSSFPWLLWYKDPLILLFPLGFCLLCRLLPSVFFLLVGVPQDSVLRYFPISCYFARVSSPSIGFGHALQVDDSLVFGLRPALKLLTHTTHCPLVVFTWISSEIPQA